MSGSFTFITRNAGHTLSPKTRSKQELSRSEYLRYLLLTFLLTTKSISDKCKKHRKVQLHQHFPDVMIGLERTWKGIFDVYAFNLPLDTEFVSNLVFDDYKKLISQARRFLYVEHQYPFQNFALTYYLCEALKANKDLKVIIVTSVKTDLPTGLVGDLFDWSQDHSIQPSDYSVG